MSGAPSIWTNFSSLTKTFWPQPTAQYGQTLRATRSAVTVRGVMPSVCAERTASPRPRWSSLVTWRSTGQVGSGGQRRHRVGDVLHEHRDGCAVGAERDRARQQFEGHHAGLVEVGPR